jgi:curved DNA-binding protein CbpA
VAVFIGIRNIKPGATQDEVKTAYHDLAYVWHPDRFQGNERRRKKAEKKFKLINEAYEKLKDFKPPKEGNNSQTYNSFSEQAKEPSAKNTSAKEIIKNHFKEEWYRNKKAIINYVVRRIIFTLWP